MKVAIVGSRKYISKNKIKEFIFKLKEKYGDDVSIISGGCRYGADKYAKKYALEFSIEYIEYPPIHETHNVHCPEPSYLYGKKYAVWNFFKRIKQIAKFSDIVVGFIPDGVKSNGTRHTLGEAEKLDKKTLVIN